LKDQISSFDMKLHVKNNQKPDGIINQIKQKPPFLTVIVLSWDRLELLRTTVLSLLANTYCPFEMIIVDNHSSENCRKWLQNISDQHKTIQTLFLDENLGGEALNYAMKMAKGDFILISENDLEYSQRWDINMLAPFYHFAELGQLSPFSPNPMIEMGELWNKKPYSVIFSQGFELKVASQNVGTSCLIRRKIIDSGIRFGNVQSANGNVLFPADAKFSSDIKRLGYLVAWSNRYQVINWGHIRATWVSSEDYYQENWSAKSSSRIDGLGEYDSFLLSLENADQAERESILKTKVGELLQELEIERNPPAPPTTYSVQSQLFVSTDNEFVPDSVSLTRANPYSPEFSVEFDLTSFGSIDQLRWDPYEGHSCRVKLSSITLIDHLGEHSSIELSQVEHNGGNQDSSSVVVFDTTDPMYIFAVSGEFTRCRLSGKWEIIELENEDKSLEVQIGEILPGTYKFELSSADKTTKIEYFESHPIYSMPFEHIQVDVIESSSSTLFLVIEVTIACDDLWVQYSFSEDARDHCNADFAEISLIQLALLKFRWTAARGIHRLLHQKTMRQLPRSSPETYSSLSPAAFNQFLAEQNKHSEH